MERTLLYYPTIDIPRLNWLHSGILYSDKISSIVPFGGVNDPEFPSTLKYLMDEGQYKPIWIRELLGNYSDKFLEFENLFISTVSSEEFCKRNKVKKEVSGEYLEQLYCQKLTDNIYRYLEGRGLIKKEYNGTIGIDEMVALFYMGILAQYVAKIEPDDLIIPSTDDKRYEDIAFNLVANKTPAFSFILEKCLPIPTEDVSLQNIIRFKKKRRNELLEFRKFIRRTQDKFQKASSNEEIKEIQMETTETIEKGISDLLKIYKDSSIKTFFSSFEGLLKLESPKLFQTLAAAGFISTPINPVVGGIVGLLGIAGGMVSSYLLGKKEIEKSEFSYLFKARQAGIL